MNIEQTNIFTGIPEIDTHMLHTLDNKTLYDISSVNQYAYELCMNDKWLRQRVRQFLVNKNRIGRRDGGLRIGTMEVDVLMAHNQGFW